MAKTEGRVYQLFSGDNSRAVGDAESWNRKEAAPARNGVTFDQLIYSFQCWPRLFGARDPLTTIC